MKWFFKGILKKLGIYHLLQRNYRRGLLFFQNTLLKWRYRKYVGGEFTCNFCNASYSRFAVRYPEPENKIALEKHHVVAGYGENTWCPNCMSTARERLVLAMLQSRLNPAGMNILHFSPEKKISEYLKAKANVISVDIVPGFYEGIDQHIQYADATRLNFKNEKFDMVIANHIMEHIPDDIKAMKEIYRVLKPGGIAFLQVPYSTTLENTIEDISINDPVQQSALFGQRDHVRIYAFKDYSARLASAGFKVEFLPPATLKEFARFALQPDEGFFICRK
ncbi:MAG: methyltransferase domain-containing protein [Chitinophagaceae bacterium]|nr:methyltransferase domain-containing protein [Chitinophagaceae bacterium]